MKKVLLVPVLAGVGMVALSATYAFPGFGQQESDGQGEGFHQRQEFGQQRGEGREGFEDREALHTAIEAGDYAGFLEIAPDKLLELITSEETFEQLQAVHTARESGDMETARELAEALGLPQRGPKGYMKGNNLENHEAIKAALDAGDYAAFVEVAGDQLLEKIDTEDTFVLFVELHEAKELGDHERAKELAEELGLGHRQMRQEGKMMNKRKGKAFFRRTMKLDDVETYDEFETQYGETRMATRITPEIFDLIKELIAAYDEGERETMKGIALQLKNLVQ